MNQLIKAIQSEQKKTLENFIIGINEVTEVKTLSAKYGYYSDLLPRGKKVDKMSITELRAYLIDRKQKAVYKAIEREVNRVKTVMSAGELTSIKIQIEWKRSRMWGNNPTAELWASFKRQDGNTDSVYIKGSSIGGCGYDKQSTAVAEVLNQVNEVLKPFYILKDKALKTDNNVKNGDLLGYGAGYGLLPSFKGGVGVSCYPKIFEKICFKFSNVASGSNFDAYTIERIGKTK